MKVTVSVMGRFHGFNLAYELERRGHLQRLITTYPKFATRKFSIPDSQVSSLFPIGAATRMLERLPSNQTLKDKALHGLIEFYDRLAARLIPRETEIFTGWSSSTLHSLKRAKSLGSIAVVDEGSTHALFQKEIMMQEYDHYGYKPTLASSGIVERELAEYQEADYILVPSQFVLKTFLDNKIPADKLKVVPYGVDLREFKPIPKEDDVFRVVFVGALTLRKGVHYLLQAFRELNLPNAELWLIGSVSAEILPFLKKFGNEKIRLKGTFTQRELFRYYSQGSIFCLPSIEEGMAMVLLQAMACGLPVVASTNTGGADLIRDGREGFIVPIRDVEFLKEKILYCHDHSAQRIAMGEAALKRVSEEFTWSSYGDRVIQAYQTMLK